MNRDYYFEYIETVELLSGQFCQTALQRYPRAFQIAGADLEKCVRNVLWQMLSWGGEREKYNAGRKSGVSAQAASRQLWADFFERLLPESALKEMNASQAEEQPIYLKALEPMQHRLVFFCLNERLFRYLLPLLNRIPEPVVVLTGCELSGNVEVDHEIYVFTLSDFKGAGVCGNPYLKKIFPHIAYYTGLLWHITQLLHPKAYVLIEGPHLESLILEAIGKEKSIPSVCLQQGWPGVMHSAFRNFRYDYYLTWGKKFNSLWEKYNPSPTFVDVGYLYEPGPEVEKEYVTFFLQAPVILLDEAYFAAFLGFIFWCARTYPAQKIYIREHPEYPLPEEYWQEFGSLPNVSRALSLPLADVFAASKIGVAAFSSTLSEGLLYDIVPFVLDFSSNPAYYPDIQQEGTGIYVKTREEAEFRMDELLNGDRLAAFKTRIAQVKDDYFTAQGEGTIRNINDFLTQLRLLG